MTQVRAYFHHHFDGTSCYANKKKPTNCILVYSSNYVFPLGQLIILKVLHTKQRASVVLLLSAGTEDDADHVECVFSAITLPKANKDILPTHHLFRWNHINIHRSGDCIWNDSYAEVMQSDKTGIYFLWYNYK